jgi:hypothetical protein
VMVSLASVPMKVANAALHMSKVPPYAEPSRLTLLRAPLGPVFSYGISKSAVE